MSSSSTGNDPKPATDAGPSVASTSTTTPSSSTSMSPQPSSNDNDNDNDNDDNNNNNNSRDNGGNHDRKRKQGYHNNRSSSEKHNQSNKHRKKNHTRKPDSRDGRNKKQDNYYGPNDDDHTKREPTPGSYAHPAQREEFGISLFQDDEEKKAVLEPSPDIKTGKRKVVMLFGFLGTKYGGFQSNPHKRTIQAEIELAMYRCGMIKESNFGFPNKYNWSNAARTDKGVHACAQVCSAKVELPATVWNDDDDDNKDDKSKKQANGGDTNNSDSATGGDCTNGTSDQKTTLTSLEQVREKFDKLLPDDIRVLDMLRVTRSFCAKTSRDRVRYQYMVPSFLLHPNWKEIFEQNNITPENRTKSKREDRNVDDNNTVDNDNDVDKDDKKETEERQGNIFGKDPYLTKEEIKTIQGVVNSYRSTTESRQRLQEALHKYKGTQHYQSFTRGIKPGQGQAQRYIESFIVQDPVIVDGVEWVPTQVVGQSFLLHQIRKMISVAVDIARGAAPLSFMDRALAKDTLFKINVAPAQGLFLEMSYYGGYNRFKDRQNAGRLPNLDWTKSGDAHDRWVAMRDVIRTHIIKEEEEFGNFVHYMYVQEFVYGVEGNYELSKSPDAHASE